MKEISPGRPAPNEERHAANLSMFTGRHHGTIFESGVPRLPAEKAYSQKRQMRRITLSGK